MTSHPLQNDASDAYRYDLSQPAPGESVTQFATDVAFGGGSADWGHTTAQSQPLLEDAMPSSSDFIAALLAAAATNPGLNETLGETIREDEVPALSEPGTANILTATDTSTDVQMLEEDARYPSGSWPGTDNRQEEDSASMASDTTVRRVPKGRACKQGPRSNMGLEALRQTITSLYETLSRFGCYGPERPARRWQSMEWVRVVCVSERSPEWCPYKDHSWCLVSSKRSELPGVVLCGTCIGTSGRPASGGNWTTPKGELVYVICSCQVLSCGRPPHLVQTTRRPKPNQLAICRNTPTARYATEPETEPARPLAE